MYIIKATDLLIITVNYSISYIFTVNKFINNVINNINKKSLIIISQSKVAIIKILNPNLNI